MRIWQGLSTESDCKIFIKKLAWGYLTILHPDLKKIFAHGNKEQDGLQS